MMSNTRTDNSRSGVRALSEADVDAIIADLGPHRIADILDATFIHSGSSVEFRNDAAGAIADLVTADCAIVKSIVAAGTGKSRTDVDRLGSLVLSIALTQIAAATFLETPPAQFAEMLGRRLLAAAQTQSAVLAGNVSQH